MKIKTKKIILAGLTGITASAALIAVSCGGPRRFDQDEQKEIKLLLGWRKANARWYALNQLIDYYNQTQADSKDFLPVKIDTDEKSYGSTFTKVITGLKTEDRSNLWNLALHYPVLIAELANYKMRLRFDKNPDNNDDYGITRDNFEKSFIDFNDNITGVPKGEISAIPFAKSTIVSAINGPILAYTLESMVAFGAKIAQKDQAWYEQVKAAGASDLPRIKQLWGQPLESERSKYANYTFDKDLVFSNGSNLIDFAMMGQQLFTNSHDNPTGGLHFLGITDVAGFYATQIFSMNAKNKDDYSNFIIQRQPNGYVDYSQILKKGTEAYKAVEEVSDKLLKAASIGAVYTKSRPSYQLRTHDIAIGIGSTSSYDENFTRSGSGSKSVISTFTINLDKNGTIVPRAITLVENVDVSVIKGDPKDATKNILDFGRGSLVKPISGTDYSNFTSNDRIIANADTEAKVKAFYDKVKAAAKDGTKVSDSLFITGNANIDALWKNESAKSKLQADGVELLGTVIVNKDGKALTHNFYGALNFKKVGDGKSVKYEELAAGPNTLQENEFFAEPSPVKWKPDDKISAVYQQGPLLIGIHANEKSDKATRKFVQWYTQQHKFPFKFYNFQSKATNEKDKYQPKYMLADGSLTFNQNEAKDKNPVQLSPQEYIFRATSYLTPYKGFFDAKHAFPERFSEIAFNQFKKGNSDQNWAVINEPVDSLSESFRSTFNSAVTGAINNYVEGAGNVAGTKHNYLDIWKRIDENKSQFGG